MVLSEADYQRLLAAGKERVPGMTAMQWLLAQPANGTASKRQLDQRLRKERDW
ncbi:MAG: hypothetical protein ACREP2_07005 [Rhodanobacteraceae bacterium]